ncbi:hypothetical protein SDC9_158816 [bioreactor metagenome]|uniref:Uncharacterized protein n=1 Tax=bioreactor metagenome TaxID=1076179 RepID=A0A645FGV0_9ZZZZ
MSKIQNNLKVNLIMTQRILLKITPLKMYQEDLPFLIHFKIVGLRVFVTRYGAHVLI